MSRYDLVNLNNNWGNIFLRIYNLAFPIYDFIGH